VEPPPATPGRAATRGRLAVAGGALALLVVGGVGGFAIGQASAGTGTSTTGTTQNAPGQGRFNGEFGTPPGTGRGDPFGGTGTAPDGTGTDGTGQTGTDGTGQTSTDGTTSDGTT
jgi:hypothetical protein